MFINILQKKLKFLGDNLLSLLRNIWKANEEEREVNTWTHAHFSPKEGQVTAKDSNSYMFKATDYKDGHTNKGKCEPMIHVQRTSFNLDFHFLFRI